MSRKSYLFVMLVALMLAVTACSSSMRAPRLDSRTLAGTWRVVSIDGIQPDQLQGCLITFDGTDHMFNVQTNCNTISGTYTFKGHNLTMDPSGSTRMACPDMSVETRLMELLPRVVKAEPQPTGTLTLTDADGNVLVSLT